MSAAGLLGVAKPLGLGGLMGFSGALLLVEVAFALALLSLALWWLGRRMAPGGQANKASACVHSTLRINASDSLHVVEMAGRRLLLGTGAGGAPRLICELDTQQAPHITPDAGLGGEAVQTTHMGGLERGA